MGGRGLPRLHASLSGRQGSLRPRPPRRGLLERLPPRRGSHHPHCRSGREGRKVRDAERESASWRETRGQGFSRGWGRG